MTGLYAVIGILGALHARHKSGTGQHVDVALTECTLAAMTNISQYYLTSGRLAPRLGNAHATIVPYQLFATADSHIVIAVGNNGQFARFATLLGAPDWATDARFAHNQDRVANRDTLTALIGERLQTQTTEYWLRGLRDVDVPCAPVNTMDKVFADEQITARGVKINMPHPLSSAGVDLVGSPLHFSATPVDYAYAPPLLGQHTQEVLEEYGYSADAVSALLKKGVVGCNLPKD